MFGNDHDDKKKQDSTVAQPVGSPGFNPALPPADHSFAPANSDTAVQPPEEPSSPPPLEDTNSAVAVPSQTNNDTSSDAPSNDSSGLLDIKQQALTQLSPLVSHLDQSPEDKFKTLMMMIQASDNQALVKEAYETAQSITDDTVKAQALLDVINEINYFTQPNEEN